RKDYASAIKDYDEAIRLNAKDSRAYFSRSIAQMLTRSGDAVTGFKTALELPSADDYGMSGSRAELPAYAPIFGYFAARLAGNEVEAKAFLGRAPGKMDVNAWPYPVIKYLRGEIDERALLSAAVDDDMRTDAHCFLGLDSATKGHKDLAMTHFRWVRTHGNP